MSEWEAYYPIWPFGRIHLTDGSFGPRDQGLFMRRKVSEKKEYRWMTPEERAAYETQSMESVL